MEQILVSELPDLLKDAVNKAIITSKKSVSDYYHYNVCAVIIDEAGNEFIGVNWEPANGATVCAETSAMSQYILSERRKITHIITFGCPEERDPNKDSFCTPCGSCRQRLNDFCSKDTVILGVNEPGTEIRQFTLEELLPHSFGAENL